MTIEITVQEEFVKILGDIYCVWTLENGEKIIRKTQYKETPYVIRSVDFIEDVRK